jgi:hypothetical protein
MKVYWVSALGRGSVKTQSAHGVGYTACDSNKQSRMKSNVRGRKCTAQNGPLEFSHNLGRERAFDRKAGKDGSGLGVVRAGGDVRRFFGPVGRLEGVVIAVLNRRQRPRCSKSPVTSMRCPHYDASRRDNQRPMPGVLHTFPKEQTPTAAAEHGTKPSHFPERCRSRASGILAWTPLGQPSYHTESQ